MMLWLKSLLKKIWNSSSPSKLVSLCNLRFLISVRLLLSWSSIVPEAFRIPIDHVFTCKEVLCASHNMERSVGSDHYPIVVEVSY